MDLHLIENILAIADEKSITRAAEKRFVTQSALNQQLQKLETELDTPLFHRSRSNWQPTPAGEIYLQAARQILLLRKDAYERIADRAMEARRHISVGMIQERGIDMFTAVYPAFHRQYPQIQIDPVECRTTEIQRRITGGQLELGLVTLEESQHDENEYHHMGYEEILLAVPAMHPLAEGGTVDYRLAPQTQLSRFAREPFVRIYQRSTLFGLSESLFAQAGFQPRVLFSTSSNISKYRMLKAGLGCALLPATYAASDGSVVYFHLPQRPRWQVAICSRKGAYISTAQRDFIGLCRQYWIDKLG